jgi:hypothetical protein
LDFSPDDLREAKALIRNMQQEGVQDELGFGVIQSAIADRLYPATSTTMTAARYLFFIPALFEWLEQQRVPSGRFETKAFQKQDELCGVLKRTEGPRSGVIGLQAGKSLTRFPSNIYWNGLRRLGLFQRECSESTYLLQLDHSYQQAASHADDDGVRSGGSEQLGFWDEQRPVSTFLDRKGNIRPDTSFRLTRAEAQDLLRRYEGLAGRPSKDEVSLMLCQVERRIDRLEFPWSLPEPPAALAEILDHARALSAAARGATLLYNGLLLEQRQRQGLRVPEVALGEAFERWFESTRPWLESWSTERFFRLPVIAAAVRDGDQRFLSAWMKQVKARRTANALFEDHEARKRIRDREREKKGYKARLVSPAHLKAWNPPEVLPSNEWAPFELSYRHDVGQRFAAEIIQGLAGTD